MTQCALRTPVELGKNNDRDIELLGESFQSTGDLGDFPFAGIGACLVSDHY